MKIETEFSAPERAMIGDCTGDARKRFAAFLLYESDQGIDEEPILDAVTKRLESAGASVAVDIATLEAMGNRKNVGVFHRRLERVPLIVRAGVATLTITVDSEQGDTEFWHRFVDPETLPDADRRIDRTRAHVSILDASFEDPVEGAEAAYDRALATTLATQAIVRLFEPLAVLWHPACHALSPEQFVRAIRPLQAEQSPLELWAAVRALECPDGGKAIATEGLLPLLGREIEAPSPGERPTMMSRLAMNLARYLIDQGGSVADGDLLDGTRRARLRVRECFSELRPGTPSFQISLEAQAN